MIFKLKICCRKCWIQSMELIFHCLFFAVFFAIFIFIILMENFLMTQMSFALTLSCGLCFFFLYLLGKLYCNISLWSLDSTSLLFYGLMFILYVVFSSLLCLLRTKFMIFISMNTIYDKYGVLYCLYHSVCLNCFLSFWKSYSFLPLFLHDNIIEKINTIISTCTYN